MKNRRDFVKNLLYAPVVLQMVRCSSSDRDSRKAGSGNAVPEPTAQPKPHKKSNRSYEKTPKNVLLIAVDDLNDWLGCYTALIGENLRPYTPNIDFLAASATLFKNAHTPVALCNPARTAIFFGVEPHISGVLNNTETLINVNNKLVPTDSQFYHRNNCHFDKKTSLNAYFKKKDYETFGIGKLYHGSDIADTDGMWDEYIDVLKIPKSCPVASAPHHPDHDPAFRTLPLFSRLEHGAAKGSLLKCPKGIIHVDQSTADGAIKHLEKLIARRDKQKKKFFMGVGFFRPHAPWYAPEECWARYSEDAIKAYVDSIIAGNKPLHPSLEKEFRKRLDKTKALYDRGEVYKYVHGYLASITFMDSQVGRVLDTLRASSLWDETIVALFSDHGYHWGEKQIIHKHTLWERATKVPFIVRVPGLSEGETSNSLVSTLGLYKTLTDLNFDERPNIAGHSVFPVLENPKARILNYVNTVLSLDGDDKKISSIGSIGYAVREERWRYILYRLKKSDGGFEYVEELYDLVKDPLERTNLVLNGRGSYEDECKRLKQYIPEAFSEVAPLPRLNCAG